MRIKNVLMTIVVLLIVIGMAGITLGGVGNDGGHRGYNNGGDGHNNDGNSEDGGHNDHNSGDDHENDHNNGDHHNGGDHGRPKPIPTPDPTPVPAVTPIPTPDPVPIPDPAPVYGSITPCNNDQSLVDGSCKINQQWGFFWTFGTCDCDRMRILAMLENQTSNETAIKEFNYKLEVIAWDSRKLDPQGMIQFCKNASYDMSPTITYYGMDKE